MSIYISGMEMPEEGWHKVIKIFTDGTVVSYYDSVELGTAIPVPEHGRLIDTDKLNYSNTDLLGNHIVYMVDIEDAPTIIPADHIGGVNEMVADKEGEG